MERKNVKHQGVRRLVTIPEASKASGLSELQILALTRKNIINCWIENGHPVVDFIELTFWTYSNDVLYRKMLKSVDLRSC